MTIQLPRDAHGYDYEDQVSALLLARGYHLETRLILKKGTEEVLEFDAIATPVTNYENRSIIEVKSGGWGISDIFKLYGQVMYMDEQDARLIHKKPVSDTKKLAIDDVIKHVPVIPLHVNIDSDDPLGAIPSGLEITDDLTTAIFLGSWWARSAERVAQKRFRDYFKSFQEPPEVVECAKIYVDAIAECLFKKTPLSRVDALYDAYKEAPKITSSLIEYIVENSDASTQAVRASAFNNHERPYLQHVAAKEFGARISIVKNAYDAVLRERNIRESDGIDWSWDDLIKSILPVAFRHGMEELAEFPLPNNIPFFLQVFIEVFGGFYYPKHDRENNAISEATGIPVDLIPDALGLLDIFFPISNGWLFKGDEIHMLKGVPAYLRGAGCFTRDSLYGEGWKTGVSSRQRQFLAEWHNALYHLLEPSLKVQE
jgi:hypothetical protein